MRGIPPRFSGDPASWAMELVSWLEQQLDEPAEVPVGTIVAFGGDVLPDGWLFCDGAEYRIDDFPHLAVAISDLWNEGVPPAAGYFKIPNLVGRVLLGADAADVGTVTGTVESDAPSQPIETPEVMYLIKV